ncbi:hypothetical protein ASG56_08485 [Rhodococcus sp. Leaf7]|nr:hypothetical protein ASG56_08485 [Rhodococcus sp. Leaf7]KQU43045.1 hypothetical protein ASG64_08480 [Rhodococcus sp. Leaf247]
MSTVAAPTRTLRDDFHTTTRPVHALWLRAPMRSDSAVTQPSLSASRSPGRRLTPVTAHR